MAECYSNYIVEAWIDSNSDGNRSNDELPLQDGIADLSRMANALMLEQYGETIKITAKPPSGYTNTTPSEITVEICDSCTVQFGFIKNHR